MISILLAVAAQTAASPPAVEPVPTEFQLVCDAVNDATATHLNFGTLFSAHRSASAVGVSSEHYQTAPEEMIIEIKGASGRMRPPPRFVNHTWHPNGWLDIVDVKVGPDEIVGKVQFSWASHPKLSLDRRTGSVYYSNPMGSYSGHCQPINTAAHAF